MAHLTSAHLTERRRQHPDMLAAAVPPLLSSFHHQPPPLAMLGACRGNLVRRTPPLHMLSARDEQSSERSSAWFNKDGSIIFTMVSLRAVCVAMPKFTLDLN